MAVIRKETKADYETVEALIRRSFYNLYIPGCVEHYLARRMRNHEDFIRELDFVIELEGGNYRKYYVYQIPAHR